MNDPNGLIFFVDEYHLFYQYVPVGEGGLHWGHAVSGDLLSWEHLPIALHPDELGNIWSGSIVVDRFDTSGFFAGDSGLVAVFTHQRPGSQSQSLAYSRDRGRSWTKFDGNPVLTSQEPDFRDPKVFWHSRTGRWVMALAVGGSVHFYVSGDLKQWRFASAFGEGRFPGNIVWECPDLFCPPITGETNQERVWVLSGSIVSPLDSATGIKSCEMRHFIGRFDGETFTPQGNPEEGWLTDSGPDNYAAMTWANAPDQRCVGIGWMNHWMYASQVPTRGWQGAMTLPRELRLERDAGGNLGLRQAPVGNWASLRVATRRWAGPCSHAAFPLPDATEDGAFELEIELRSNGARECGVLLGAAGGPQTKVGYDAARQVIFLDRTQSGAVDFHPHFASRHAAPLEGRDASVRWRMIVDRCSVEVFAGDGAAVITALVFPPAACREVAFYSREGDAVLVEMALHALQSSLSLVPG